MRKLVFWGWQEMGVLVLTIIGCLGTGRKWVFLVLAGNGCVGTGKKWVSWYWQEIGVFAPS